MSAAWIAAVAIAAAAGGVAKAVTGGMVQEEARTRLSRIPFALIALAAARVAPDMRDDLADEWNAELEFLLTGTDGMPVTRFTRGVLYAAGLLISARAVTEELTGPRANDVARLARIAVGLNISAVGISSIASAIAYQAGHHQVIAVLIGESCMDLNWAVGGVLIALRRFPAFLAMPGYLLLCLSYIVFYLHQPDVRSLVGASVFFAGFAVTAAAKMMTRRQRRRPYAPVRQ